MGFLVGWSTLFAVLLTVTMLAPFLMWRCRSLPVPPAPAVPIAPLTSQHSQPSKNTPTSNQPIPTPGPQPPHSTPPLVVAPATMLPLPLMPLPRGGSAKEFALHGCTSMQEALDQYAVFHGESLQHVATNGCQQARYLVMVADEGLGNRLRVLVSLYLMAMITKRVFVVDWVHPFPLDNIFTAPVGLNWTAKAPVQCTSKLYDFSSNKLNSRIDRMKTDDFVASYPEPVVRIKTTIPFYGYLVHHEVWGPVLRRLFGMHGIPQLLQYLAVPSPAVQRLVDPLLQRVGNGELISVHLRTGVVDRQRNLWINDKTTHFLMSCVLTTFHMKVRHKRNPFVFMASDSAAEYEWLAKRIPPDRFLRVPGRAAHIASEQHSLEDYQKAAADWFMLGEADLRFGTGGSSFSAMAMKRKAGLTYLFPRDHASPEHIMLNLKSNDLTPSIPEWCLLQQHYSDRLAQLPEALRTIDWPELHGIGRQGKGSA
uniref:Uncharacterized protein n=1 Tax=Eutreptiella gymnastica TaxID=73025 RepID=A0A7S1I7S9_9EUGL|mmetsp:Transcript_137005/g.238191  ORF Transcript_137005/g.238191 Transcript_137005/m.238191 type:complete len:481 (+) Transcript_137005:88-1530(+)